MATEAELTDALRNADKAGAKEDANKLADALVKMRQAKAAPSDKTLTLPKEKPSDTAGFVSGNLYKGLAQLIGMPVDALTSAINQARVDMGMKPYAPEEFAGGSQQIEDWIRKAGLITPAAAPETAGGRVGAAALQALPTGLLGGETSIPSLIRSLAAAGTSGAASQTAAEAGGGPIAQLAAGAVAPTAITGIRPIAAAKEAVTRGAPVAERITTAQRAGVMVPPAGVVTDSKALRTGEAVLSKLPGASTVLHEAARRRAEGMGARAGEVSRGLAPAGASMEQAGTALRSGIEHTVQGFRATQDRLYARVRSLVPPATQVQPSRFLAMLAEKTRAVPGAEKVTAALAPSDLRSLMADIQQDLTRTTPAGAVLGPGGKPLVPATTTLTDRIPFEAADLIRKRLGDKLEADALVAGTPKSAYKALYGAITSDMENALPAGSAARKAWARARSYTRAGHDRIDNVLQPLYDRRTPEQALRAALAGTQHGASAFRRIMNSLTPAQSDVIRANVIDGLGKAVPGAQTAAGNTFSVDTFVTNWNKLHPDARRVLFRNPQLRDDMNAIAITASRLKESGRALYNPSGTGEALMHGGAAGGFIGALMSGHPLVAGSIAADVGANWGLAKVMTNPKFIHWLAQGTKLPPDRRLQWAAQLGRIASQEQDPEMQPALQSMADFAKLNP